ncbi:MAG TPA: response regulator [Anaerolineae bacterium]|nr:response regulator [Anaerolineae bacterium]
MDAKEVVEAILQFTEILTACTWPLTLLLVLFLFRQQIRSLLPEVGQQLGKRLKRAEFAGTKLEFSEIAVSALQDAIETGAEEFKDQPDEFVGFVRKQVEKLPEIQTATHPASAPTLTGQSILWVDDNPVNNVYESSVLKRLGVSIVFARSTQEALAFLQGDSYNLIISDVHRVEDGRSNPSAGYELLEALNQMNEDTPLVFYTGSVARMDRLRAQSAYGAADTPSACVNLAVHALQESRPVNPLPWKAA